MTKQWTGTDIIAALGCAPVLSDDVRCKNISIDTRTLEAGDVYVALKGEGRHGAEFIGDAFSKGAAAVITDQPEDKYPQCIVADDSQKALEQLGAFARKQSSAKRVAITGSCGKTTTKEWLGEVFSAYGPTVRSKASYNNHLGVPLSLTQLDAETKFGVFEIGMNHCGEISPLSKFVQPDLAIITTIAEAHIGHFKSLEEIAEEKACIFDGLSKAGTALIPLGAPFYEVLQEKALSKTKNVFSFQLYGADVADRKADAFINSVNAIQDGGLKVNASVLGEDVSFVFRSDNKYLLSNILAVLLTVKIFGLSLDVAVNTINSLEPVTGRGKVESVSYKGIPITLIDDAYNANPASMTASLVTLNERADFKNGRRILVLGEMRELGDFSKELHLKLRTPILDVNPALVFCVGEGMDPLYKVLPDSMKGGFCQNAKDIIPLVTQALKPHDLVFVKGSNGSGVHTLVSYFKRHTQPEPAAA